MRFVVATLPNNRNPLVRDVLLVKSSALYADETLLFSPTYFGMEPFVDFTDRPTYHQMLWLAVMLRDPGILASEKLTPAQKKKRYENARKRALAFITKAKDWMELELARKELSPEMMLFEAKVKRLAQSIKEGWGDDHIMVQRIHELKKAEELGLVQIQQLHEEPDLYVSIDKLVSDVTDALSASDAYGAFDDRFVAHFKKSSPGQNLKQKVVHVADEMFKRLPLFEEASFDEIRDIKQELRPYLTNFRRGLLEISQQVRSEPWNKDFPHAECVNDLRQLF